MKLSNKIAGMLCTAIVYFNSVSPVLAADIYWLNQHPMGCDVMLEGIITGGDTEKLQNLVAEHPAQDPFSDISICLNSPGGELLEGIKLAHYFINHPTVIPEDGVCESACAVAFLGGTYPPGEGQETNERFTARRMHHTAKLGFHSPALSIQDGLYSEKAVEKAYKLALLSIAELSSLRLSDIDIKESLFDIILRTPFDEMTYIDTVGQALRYDIFVPGIEFSLAPPNIATINICDHAIAVLEDTKGDENLFADIPPSNSFSLDGNTITTPPRYFTEGTFRCRVTVEDGGALMVEFDGSLPVFLPPMASFDYDTRLDQIKPTSMQDAISFMNTVMLEMQSQHNNSLKCGVDTNASKIVNVSDYTNFRMQPGLGSRVIGRIRLGDYVSIVNPGSFLRTERCASACEGIKQEAINRCIDNNEVWIEVIHKGSRGYLSRKFLTEIK